MGKPQAEVASIRAGIPRSLEASREGRIGLQPPVESGSMNAGESRRLLLGKAAADRSQHDILDDVTISDSSLHLTGVTGV